MLRKKKEDTFGNIIIVSEGEDESPPPRIVIAKNTVSIADGDFMLDESRIDELEEERA